MAAQEPLAQDILQLCLSCLGLLAVAMALPPQHRPKCCSWLAVAQATVIMVDPECLRPTLRAYLLAASSSSIVAGMATAAQLAQQLALDESLSGDDKQRIDARHLLLVLLSSFCKSGLQREVATALQRLDSHQRQRLPSQLMLAVSRLPQLLLLSISRGHPELERNMLAAARGTVACLVDVLNSNASGGGSSSGAQSPPPLPGGWADAAAWTDAACGALRCVPVAQRLHESDQQNEEPHRFVTHAACFADVAALRMQATCVQVCSTAAKAQARLAVWQLHSRLAQLVHFAATAGSPLLSFSDVPWMSVSALNACVGAASQLYRTDPAAAEAVQGSTAGSDLR